MVSTISKVTCIQNKSKSKHVRMEWSLSTSVKEIYIFYFSLSDFMTGLCSLWVRTNLRHDSQGKGKRQNGQTAELGKDGTIQKHNLKFCFV